MNSVTNSSMIPAQLAAQLPNPKTPWHMSQGLFERVHKESSGAGAGTKPFTAMPVTSSDPEFAFVMRYFNHSKPKNFGIRNILCIHNPVSTHAFEALLLQTEMSAKGFPPSWKEEEPKAERAATFARWNQQVEQFSPFQLQTAKRIEKFATTKVVPLWHGTKRAEAICSNGFAFFGKHALFENAADAGPNVDIGFFGSGIYFTNSAQYAAMYSANKVGGTLLLAWVSMREPYPVVSDTPVPKEGTDMTRLQGKGAYKNYNAHYIPITSTDPADPENMVYHPCHRSEKPAWDEYVVFHTAQTLACFQVELGVDFPASISPVGPGAGPGVGPGALANSVENLLDKLLELLDCSEVQADKELASLLSSKSDAIASLNLKSALSPQDQEFYNWTLKLLDPAGKPRNLVKQKLMQKPTASPPKLEGKEAASISALTEEVLTALHKQASAGDAEALQKLKQQAEAGVASAQNMLGNMYAEGTGVTKDEREAVRLYQLAAAQGYAKAQCNLGFMYREGQGVAKDGREAVRLYQLAIAQGYAGAQCDLGFMYREGRGVAKDEREAVRLYQLAAKQGDAEGQQNLGFMYEYGRGVAKDEREAVRLYQLAASQGRADAQYNLGLMYANGRGVAKDESKAIGLYQLAAAQGYALAQNKLGFMYEYGRGVAKDEREAVRLYQLAAAQGHALAQHNLGFMYEGGRGVAKDEREAVRLYQLAAAQGNAHAQCNLGFMYADGRGIAKDEREAVRLYQLAVAQGHALAQNNLGCMHRDGRGIAKDEREAVRLYQLAAAQGHALAQCNLGFMYEYGLGVAKDEREAVRLYQLAAAQGEAYAQQALKRLG